MADNDINNDFEDDDLDEMAMQPKVCPEYHDFYMYDEPLSSMDVTEVSFENNPLVRNHIIVCGVPSSIKSFIKPLRAKYLSEDQLLKVVIITGESEDRGGDQLDPKIWNSIS